MSWVQLNSDVLTNEVRVINHSGQVVTLETGGVQFKIESGTHELVCSSSIRVYSLDVNSTFWDIQYPDDGEMSLTFASNGFSLSHEYSDGEVFLAGWYMGSAMMICCVFFMIVKKMRMRHTDDI